MRLCWLEPFIHRVVVLFLFFFSLIFITESVAWPIVFMIFRSVPMRLVNDGARDRHRFWSKHVNPVAVLPSAANCFPFGLIMYCNELRGTQSVTKMCVICKVASIHVNMLTRPRIASRRLELYCEGDAVSDDYNHNQNHCVGELAVGSQIELCCASRFDHVYDNSERKPQIKCSRRKLIILHNQLSV